MRAESLLNDGSMDALILYVRQITAKAIGDSSR